MTTEHDVELAEASSPHWGRIALLLALLVILMGGMWAVSAVRPLEPAPRAEDVAHPRSD